MKNIGAALRQQLAATVDPADVQWENRPYKPTNGQPWYRETLLPAEPQKAGVGSGAASRYIGLYQIDVFTPAGEGVFDAASLADALLSAYGWGTTVTYGGVSVRVEKSYKRTGRQEPDWYHVPVIIEWRADIT